jgi:hypothetical protein
MVKAAIAKRAVVSINPTRVFCIDAEWPLDGVAHRLIQLSCGNASIGLAMLT